MTADISTGHSSSFYCLIVFRFTAVDDSAATSM